MDNCVRRWLLRVRCGRYGHLDAFRRPVEHDGRVVSEWVRCACGRTLRRIKIRPPVTTEEYRRRRAAGQALTRYPSLIQPCHGRDGSRSSIDGDTVIRGASPVTSQ
jgi:hypothetical protein